MQSEFEAIVIGGGPAGLSAALILGRCMRRTLVLDSGTYRNQAAQTVNGFLGRDGSSPPQLLADARLQLQDYNVRLESSEAVDVCALASGGFSVSTPKVIFTAPGLLFATGTEDQLPNIPGLDACWGVSAHVCPYCDAWENRDAALAVLGESENVVAYALHLREWSRDIVLCTNGSVAPIADRGRELHELGIKVMTQAIAGLDATDGVLRAIQFEDGMSLPRQALFLCAGQRPRDKLLRNLNCRTGERGIVCDPDGATSVPGVYIAGDVSRDVQLAIVGAAEGARAAIALDRYVRTARQTAWH